MKKQLFLLPAILLCASCNYQSNSFHREFFHNSKKAYLTFCPRRSEERNLPGTGFNDDDPYSYYLDEYLNSDESYKELTYKKRDGYLAIYMKISDTEKTEYFEKGYFESDEFKSGLEIYYISQKFDALNRREGIKNGTSRYVFKDFKQLDERVYEHKETLTSIISYVDVFDGGNKLYTTYIHYNLETFKSEDFYFDVITYTGDPSLANDKTYSSFPHEGTFISKVYPDSDVDSNFFSSKYLNTYFPILKDNHKNLFIVSLSNFRLETIIDNQIKYILIPNYAIEENESSWGKYLDSIIDIDNERITKKHHTGNITYIKVPISKLHDL